MRTTQTERAIKTRNRRIVAYFATLSIALVSVAVYTLLDRLTTEALAVLAGAVCGVGAAIPTSLLIIAVSRQGKAEQPREPKPQLRHQQGTYPPIVVVAPGAQRHQLPGWGWRGGSGIMDPPPAERHFTVVGGDLDD